MKQTYSIPGILDFDAEGITNSQGKKIASSCEIAYLCLSGGGPASVYVHNCQSVAAAGYNNRKMTLDVSAAGNDNRIFFNPVEFNLGVTVILNQGAGLNAVLSYGTVTPR